MLNGAGCLPVVAGAASVTEGAIAIVEAKRKPSLRFMSVILCWLLLKSPHSEDTLRPGNALPGPAFPGLSRDMLRLPPPTRPLAALRPQFHILEYKPASYCGGYVNRLAELIVP